MISSGPVYLKVHFWVFELPLRVGAEVLDKKIGHFK